MKAERDKGSEKNSRSSYRTVFLPYNKAVTENFNRLCRPLDLRTIIKSSQSLRNKLTKVKQVSENKTNCVCEEIFNRKYRALLSDI